MNNNIFPNQSISQTPLTQSTSPNKPTQDTHLNKPISTPVKVVCVILLDLILAQISYLLILKYNTVRLNQYAILTTPTLHKSSTNHTRSTDFRSAQIHNESSKDQTGAGGYLTEAFIDEVLKVWTSLLQEREAPVWRTLRKRARWRPARVTAPAC